MWGPPQAPTAVGCAGVSPRPGPAEAGPWAAHCTQGLVLPPLPGPLAGLNPGRFILVPHSFLPSRTIGDRMGEAKASGNLGNTLKVLGRFDEAIVCCQRHLDIAQEQGDKVGCQPPGCLPVPPLTCGPVQVWDCDTPFTAPRCPPVGGRWDEGPLRMRALPAHADTMGLRPSSPSWSPQPPWFMSVPPLPTRRICQNPQLLSPRMSVQ